MELLKFQTPMHGDDVLVYNVDRSVHMIAVGGHADIIRQALRMDQPLQKCYAMAEVDEGGLITIDTDRMIHDAADFPDW